ncbi:ABC transporter ATP-binding protein [Paraburkholderia hayleyella]|uniref:ABC transporter ATP-binding protein n=1 Tax=Paraburkholderia hayleyella TaxID=2152889 RepID=UPI0012927CC1|nr:ABC transporter ATP-binding protein [Paraburkholderia hayleyella]
MDTALALYGIEKCIGATPILCGVDLVLERGERHALIGPNGAGKSTLFNLIAGVDHPDAGRIELAGRDITRLTPQAVSRLGLARSFQTTRVFGGLSVLDNLRCAVSFAVAQQAGAKGHWRRLWRDSRETDARAARMLDALGLNECQDARAEALSYAGQRALDLGLALVGGAHTILLDEPTAGMNRAEAARAMALIRATTAGRTVLLVEHDMEAVFGFAERISVLVQGRVLATGTPAAIRAHAGVRAAYLGEGWPG